jgi:DNA-binding Xre family transcriptional regulator
MPTGTRGEPGPFTRALAAALRGCLGERDMLAKDLSTASGIPKSTLSRILSGKTAIWTDQLDALCRALSVSPLELIARAERIRRND